MGACGALIAAPSNCRVGLFCDREDWILGTAAREIVRQLREQGDFRFYISSESGIYMRPVRELLQLASCDVIHWIAPFGFIHFGSLFAGKPQLCTIHHSLDGDDTTPLTYEGAKVLTMSAGTLKELTRRGFEGVEVVHYGVNTEVYTPMSRRECRRILGLGDDDVPLVGFFGKGSSNPLDRKGTSALLETMRLVNRHRRVGVLLGGEGWSGLTHRLLDAGVPVFERRAEAIEDMKLLFGSINLYLCLSRTEGGPMPVLEAMACERPVVATPVGHVPEAIRNSENGLIVPVDDVFAAADSVLEILEDSQLAKSLARNGRKTILESWTWTHSLQSMAGIYRRAIAERASARRSSRRIVRDFSMLIARSMRHRFLPGGILASDVHSPLLRTSS